MAPTLGLGGAERVLAIMANYWSLSGWRVSIVTLDSASERVAYRLDPQIGVYRLGLVRQSGDWLSGTLSNLRRIAVLRDAIKATKAQVVISFIDTTNVLTLLATVGLAVPVIVSEHSDPWKWDIGPLWNRLRRFSYRRAARIIVQGSHARSYFAPALDGRVSAIPNPVVVDTGTPVPATTVQRPTIMMMGRLSSEKAFDVAIRAFAKLPPRFSNWKLTIVGDGPLRQYLGSVCEQLGLENRVLFTGSVSPSEPVLRQADIFALSSHIEGFPMALCEAMICGLPVIATEYSPGVHEIVADGHDGLVVPARDVNGVARAMERLMSDAAFRQKLGRNAQKLKSRCSVEAVMRQWEIVVEEVLQ